MPRPSPASTRFIELLDFLAAHPDESFRLSEIGRRIGVNKATMHGTLGALVDADYLVHDAATKTFRLGTAVAWLGAAAVAHESKLAALAQPELDRLSREVGTQCLVNVILGDELLTVASAGEPIAGRGFPVGYRARMVPPLGMFFYPWTSDAYVDDWLDRISADAPERSRYRKLSAVVRERGYSISIDHDTREILAEALERLGDDTSDGDARRSVTSLITEIARRDHELDKIAPERTYRIRQISVPVLDAESAIRMGLVLTGFPELPGELILAHAQRAVETAARISRTISGGGPPASDGLS